MSFSETFKFAKFIRRNSPLIFWDSNPEQIDSFIQCCSKSFRNPHLVNCPLTLKHLVEDNTIDLLILDASKNGFFDVGLKKGYLIFYEGKDQELTLLEQTALILMRKSLIISFEFSEHSKYGMLKLNASSFSEAYLEMFPSSN